MSNYLIKNDNSLIKYGHKNVSNIVDIIDKNTHIINTTKYFFIISLKLTCFLLNISLIREIDTFNAYRLIKLITIKFIIWCGKIYPIESNVPPNLYLNIIEVIENPKIKLLINIKNIIIGIPIIDTPSNQVNMIYIKLVDKLVLRVYIISTLLFLIWVKKLEIVSPTNFLSSLLSIVIKSVPDINPATKSIDTNTYNFLFFLNSSLINLNIFFI